MQIIKLVNYGKNKTYIYSAIVLINGIYFWTKFVYFQNKKDIKTHDFTKESILKELNQKNIDIQEKRQQVQLQFAKRNIKWYLHIMHIYLFSKQRFPSGGFFQPAVQNRL